MQNPTGNTDPTRAETTRAAPSVPPNFTARVRLGPIDPALARKFWDRT